MAERSMYDDILESERRWDDEHRTTKGIVKHAVENVFGEEFEIKEETRYVDGGCLWSDRWKTLFYLYKDNGTGTPTTSGFSGIYAGYVSFDIEGSSYSMLVYDEEFRPFFDKTEKIIRKKSDLEELEKGDG